MTSEGQRSSPMVYELTVSGELGPVLRAVLQPCDAVETQACTIIRADGQTAWDIIDLMRLLDSKGLDIEEVFRVSND